MNGIDLFFSCPSLLRQPSFACCMRILPVCDDSYRAAEELFLLPLAPGNEIPGSAGFAGAAYYLARCCLCFVP